MRIEICGGIASGKTSLTQTLAEQGLEAVLEDFRAVPFWEAFYRDPASFAFETEVGFLLQHYHQIHSTAKSGRHFACDFSLQLDRAYAAVTLDQSQRTAFEAVAGHALATVGPADLTIHLVCAPEIELQRIRRRGREPEQAISLRYLSDLGRAIDAQLASITSPKLVIDSGEIDFANSEEGKRYSRSEVFRALSRLSAGPPVQQ